MIRKKITLNPFYALLISIFLINSFYLLRGHYTDRWLIEGFILRSSLEWINLAYFLFLGSILLILISFYIIKKSSPSLKLKSLSISNTTGTLLAILQLGYWFFNNHYGINIAGSVADYTGPFKLNRVFSILNPDYIFIAISTCIRNKRIFYANSFIYLISNLSRGWMGSVLIIVLIICCRQEKITLTKKNLLFLLIFTLSLLLSLPFFIELKGIIRGGGSFSIAISNTMQLEYFNALLNSFEYVTNRLQHIGNIALIIENSEAIFNAYNSNQILPYWQDGIPQSIFKKLLNATTHEPALGSFAVPVLFEMTPQGYTWNIHTGLGGWLAFLSEYIIIFIFYILLIIVVPGIVIARYGNYKLILVLMTGSVIYLLHGWIPTYIDLAMYLTIFVLLKKTKVFKI